MQCLTEWRDDRDVEVQKMAKRRSLQIDHDIMEEVKSKERERKTLYKMLVLGITFFIVLQAYLALLLSI